MIKIFNKKRVEMPNLILALLLVILVTLLSACSNKNNTNQIITPQIDGVSKERESQTHRVQAEVKKQAELKKTSPAVADTSNNASKNEVADIVGMTHKENATSVSKDDKISDDSRIIKTSLKAQLYERKDKLTPKDRELSKIFNSSNFRLQVILFAPPGLDKAPIVNFIAAKYNVMPAAMKYVTLDEIHRNTKLGKKLYKYLDKKGVSGDSWTLYTSLSDDLLYKVLKQDVLYNPDAKSGFALSAYPFNTKQAKKLMSYISTTPRNSTFVVVIESPLNELISTLKREKDCSRCNVKIEVDDANLRQICSECLNVNKISDSYTEELLIKRSKEYESVVTQMIDFYATQKQITLIKIESQKDPASTFALIDEAITNSLLKGKKYA